MKGKEVLDWVREEHKLGGNIEYMSVQYTHDLLSYITALERVAGAARVDRDDLCDPDMPDCMKTCEIRCICRALNALDQEE